MKGTLVRKSFQLGVASQIMNYLEPNKVPQATLIWRKISKQVTDALKIADRHQYLTLTTCFKRGTHTRVYLTYQNDLS